jgi:hypothetical protein
MRPAKMTEPHRTFHIRGISSIAVIDKQHTMNEAASLFLTPCSQILQPSDCKSQVPALLQPVKPIFLH